MQVNYKTSDGSYGKQSAGFIDHSFVFVDNRIEDIILMGADSEKALKANMLTFAVRNVEEFSYSKTKNSS